MTGIAEGVSILIWNRHRWLVSGALCVCGDHVSPSLSDSPAVLPAGALKATMSLSVLLIKREHLLHVLKHIVKPSTTERALEVPPVPALGLVLGLKVAPEMPLAMSVRALVEAHGQFMEGFFDLPLRGVFGNAQDLVEIFFGQDQLCDEQNGHSNPLLPASSVNISECINARVTSFHNNELFRPARSMMVTNTGPAERQKHKLYLQVKFSNSNYSLRALAERQKLILSDPLRATNARDPPAAAGESVDQDDDERHLDSLEHCIGDPSGAGAPVPVAALQSFPLHVEVDPRADLQLAVHQDRGGQDEHGQDEELRSAERQGHEPRGADGQVPAERPAEERHHGSADGMIAVYGHGHDHVRGGEHADHLQILDRPAHRVGASEAVRNLHGELRQHLEEGDHQVRQAQVQEKQLSASVSFSPFPKRVEEE
ncbi:hypothetical protein DNTS_017661 [Danionella cerebrum]|uniref:Uncharacterized protein n=1 Tax=Danionella cerebrum TaxID=2873325 RepID=A0A553MXK6_9TELE|nr:hypothetical protein DNTS_017661 [Danionella translucida]